MSAEALIESFWNSHPCGENLVARDRSDYDEFFQRYDQFRYSLESHIPRCLDRIPFKDKATLEIGLGQGADSEQIIRRGARWSGVDLTEESVNRVRARLSVRDLPFETVRKGSATALPFADATFDIVYSHGVLHHIPDIDTAQREIARVHRPGGMLVAMVYAKHSLNYLLSIAILRRLGLLGLYLIGARGSGIYATHLAQAKKVGIRRYLALDHFVHRNTDGPLNPYSKVYDRRELEADFSRFRIVELHREFMHAPPLPVHGLPGARWLGWHLWAHMVSR